MSSKLKNAQPQPQSQLQAKLQPPEHRSDEPWFCPQCAKEFDECECQPEAPWAFCPACTKGVDKCKCEPCPKGWYRMGGDLGYIYCDGDEFSLCRIYYAHDAGKWNVSPRPHIRCMAEFDKLNDAQKFAKKECIPYE